MKKSFGLGLSLLIAAAMLNGCGAAPSGNNSAVASNNKQSAVSGEQQSTENSCTVLLTSMIYREKQLFPLLHPEGAASLMQLVRLRKGSRMRT